MINVDFILHAKNWQNFEPMDGLSYREYLTYSTGNCRIYTETQPTEKDDLFRTTSVVLSEETYCIKLGNKKNVTEEIFLEKIKSIRSIIDYQSKNIHRRYPNMYNINEVSDETLHDLLFMVNNSLYSRWINLFPYSSNFYMDPNSEVDSLKLTIFQKDFGKGYKIKEIKISKVLENSSIDKLKQTLLDYSDRWDADLPRNLDEILNKF